MSSPSPDAAYERPADIFGGEPAESGVTVRLLHTAGRGVSSLPAALTPLVGRAREIDRIASLLRDSSIRLLVLTGPGGVGKTRLAVAAATRLEPSFADGGVFVDLSSVQSVDLVPAAIATALNIRVAGDQPALEVIHEAIHGHELLLVVDNLEHLTDAAPILTDLLMSVAGLSILATSRSVLGVYGEHVYAVPPMTLPVDDPIGITETAIERIAACEAVQLFVSRARAVQPSFGVTADNAGNVATICRRLDGLPLAIELAAARLGVFTLSSLADRLEQRLPLPHNGRRGVPNRQRTMQNAISWSYDLLTSHEQAVFRRLAILTGNWTIEDALAIAFDGDDARRTDDEDDLETIASLVDKSLIRQIETGDQMPHFGMLQPLQLFGREQLDMHGEREEAERRHALHMLAVAEAAAPELTGPDQVTWLHRLAGIHPDLRLAFSWLLEHGHPELALRLAAALWRFAYTRGHLREAREWIETALDRAPERTAYRAAALNGAGVLSNMEGDLARTRRLQTEALEIGREIGDQRAMGVALIGLADVAAADADYGEAERRLTAAKEVFAGIDDRRGVATINTNLGNLYWDQGDHERAVEMHEQARQQYGEIDDLRGVAWSVTNIGRIAAEQEDYLRAVENLAEALRHYDALGDRPGIAETLEGFALIAHGTGASEQAVRLLAAAHTLRQTISRPVAHTERARYDRLLGRIRQRIGASFDRIWDEGTRLPLDQAEALTRDVVARASVKPAVAATVQSDRRYGLTDREMDVFELLGAGHADKEIAEVLHIGVRTVQSHVANILGKLEVNSRSAAVARAFREGILQ